MKRQRRQQKKKKDFVFVTKGRLDSLGLDTDGDLTMVIPIKMMNMKVITRMLWKVIMIISKCDDKDNNTND